MITLKTLEVFLEKCEAANAEVVKARSEKFEQIKQLEEQRRELNDQLKVIAGQMMTLQDLMKSENHHVELPFAGEDIEEMHASRLVGHKGMTSEEIKRFREDKAYLRESMDLVEQIDEANRANDAEGQDAGTTITP